MSSISGTPSTTVLPCLTSKRIVLPIDMILHMARFMSFLDYRHFILALWPDYEDRCDLSIRQKLWQLSTGRITTLFINGMPLEIEYNFDPTRLDGPVLINTESLRPIFGESVFREREKFLRVKTIKRLVYIRIHLNMCTDNLYASCPCGPNVDNETAKQFKKPLHSNCEKKHLQHYCCYHINYWLDKQDSAIQRIEQTGVFDREAVEDFVSFLDNKVYFRGPEMQIVDSLLCTTAEQSRQLVIY